MAKHRKSATNGWWRNCAAWPAAGAKTDERRRQIAGDTRGGISVRQRISAALAKQQVATACVVLPALRGTCRVARIEDGTAQRKAAQWRYA